MPNEFSPSVGDPTTAVPAIGHLASLSADVAHRSGAVLRAEGPDATVRVVVAVPSAPRPLALVCRPVVRSGSAHPEALLAVVHLLRYPGDRGAIDNATLRDEVALVGQAG